MKKSLRVVTKFMAAFIMVFWTVPCSAAESVIKETLQDALYGGVAGTLVGAAVMAFTKRSGEHLDYLGYGAAGGAIVGAAVGLTIFNRSLAAVEKGKVKFAIPTIIPEFRDANSKGQSAYILTGDLLSGRF
jgi:hypothetical protein